MTLTFDLEIAIEPKTENEVVLEVSQFDVFLDDFSSPPKWARP